MFYNWRHRNDTITLSDETRAELKRLAEALASALAKARASMADETQA